MVTFRDLLETYLAPQVAALLAMAVPKPQVPAAMVRAHNKISALRYATSNNMPKATESEGLMPGERAVLWEKVETEVQEEWEELEEPAEEQELEAREETEVPHQPQDSNVVSELVRLGAFCSPPPGSMPRTGLLGPNAMEQPNRNMAGLGRSMLC